MLQAQPQASTASRLPRRVVSIALPDATLAALEEARGQESRSSFVARVLAAALRSPKEPVHAHRR